jgi:hypothetical protein
MQVLHLGRIYSVPVVHEQDGQFLLFSGWWFGGKQARVATPEIAPQTPIRIALTGQGLRWTREFKLEEICRGEPLQDAESDAHQGILRQHVSTLEGRWSPIGANRNSPRYARSGILSPLQGGVLWPFRRIRSRE